MSKKRLDQVSGGLSTADYGVDMSYTNGFIDNSQKNVFKVNIAPNVTMSSGQKVAFINNHQDITTTNDTKQSSVTSTNIEVNLF